MSIVLCFLLIECLRLLKKLVVRLTLSPNRHARLKLQQLDPKKVLGLKQGVLKNMLALNAESLTLGRNQVQVEVLAPN